MCRSTAFAKYEAIAGIDGQGWYVQDDCIYSVFAEDSIRSRSRRTSKTNLNISAILAETRRVGTTHIRLGEDCTAPHESSLDLPLRSQVMDNGLGSSIMTFYEITDGDLSDTTGEAT